MEHNEFSSDASTQAQTGASAGSSPQDFSASSAGAAGLDPAAKGAGAPTPRKLWLRMAIRCGAAGPVAKPGCTSIAKRRISQGVSRSIVTTGRCGSIAKSSKAKAPLGTIRMGTQTS